MAYLGKNKKSQERGKIAMRFTKEVGVFKYWMSYLTDEQPYNVKKMNYDWTHPDLPLYEIFGRTHFSAWLRQHGHKIRVSFYLYFNNWLKEFYPQYYSEFDDLELRMQDANWTDLLDMKP